MKFNPNLIPLLFRIGVLTIIALLLFTYVPGQTPAAVKAQGGTGTVQVDPGGADTAGCGSPASPCRTIAFAVDQAAEGDDIVVAAGTYRETIQVDKKVRLLGAGPGLSIIDGENKRGPLVFITKVPSGAELSGFTIRNGLADAGAGVRLFQSSVQLQDLTIQNNRATGVGGGGVWVQNSSATINNITVENNKATATPDGTGGGFYFLESEADLTQVTVRNNSAVNQGGGIHLNKSPDVSMDQMTIQNNTAGIPVSSGKSTGDAGGGVYMYESSPVIKDSLIEGNEANKQGGGLYLSVNSAAILQNVTIRDNAAYGTTLGGGGIYIFQSGPTLVDCLIEENTALDGGGGIWLEQSFLKLQDSLVQYNTVPGTLDGGAGIYTFRSSVSIVDTIFQFNTAASETYGGGGAFNLQSTTGTLNRVTITGNQADERGGGVLIRGDSFGDGSHITILDSEITNNDGHNGGGFYITDATVTIQNSTISNNTAAQSGGGFNIQYSGTANVVVTIEDSEIEYNQAYGSGSSAGGGGFFISGTNNHLDLQRSRVMYNNTQGGAGGGLHLRNKPGMNLTNNFIGFNSAGLSGGGIYNISETSSTLIHNTIARNNSGSGGGGLHCQGGSHTLAKLILWNNQPDNLYENIWSSTCMLADITLPLTTNPQFINENGGDFHLTAGSPAINQGGSWGINEDIDGQLRDSSPDIGADEALAEVSIIKTGRKEDNEVTYILTFANEGSLPAAAVQIADTVPSILSNLSVEYNAPVKMTQTSGPPAYRWDVEDLEPGQGGTITITGQYGGDDKFSNTATIQTRSQEADTANNSSSITLPQQPLFLPLIVK